MRSPAAYRLACTTIAFISISKSKAQAVHGSCYYPRNADGKKREEGFGPAAKVSPKLAREKRDARIKQLANGVDPIEEKS